mgnify:CR=1 FL=1
MAERRYFGTDGVRGTVGEGFFTPDFVLRLGWAIGCVLRREGKGTVVVGNQITDSATLANGVNPTGAISFKLYGPNDATCAGAPVVTINETVDSVNGTYSTFGYGISTAGTWRWIASYSGDANNNPAVSACGLAVETVKITPFIPTLGQLGLVLLGTGSRQRFPGAAILALFLTRGVGVEVMDNAAAARTFNVLAAEGRRAVAAFMLPAAPTP